MISIIAIMGTNRAIGKDNKLLWNIPKDMSRFKRITSGHTVIMGEKTFLSIGKALPDRRNIVVTFNKNFNNPDVEIRYSLEDVLNEHKNTSDEVFVIGGGMVYAYALAFTHKLYLTIVDDAPHDADTFFPDYREFTTILNTETYTGDTYSLKFLELTR